MSDDGKKTVLSLVKKREETCRNFAREQDEMATELLELGFSAGEAQSIARDVALCDWLVYRASIIAQRDGDVIPVAAVLIEAIGRRRQRGIRRCDW